MSSKGLFLFQCAAITLDYKLNFTPEKTDKIPELHERVAQRVYDLLTSNGGLYIKIGYVSGISIYPIFFFQLLSSQKTSHRRKRRRPTQTHANQICLSFR